MLVLSRRQHERIVFANLDICVEVLRLRGNTVRLGIDAPAHVQVLREEVAQRAEFLTSTVPEPASRHELRNRFNTTTLALHLLQKQLHLGMEDEAEVSLHRALDELVALENLLAGVPSTAAAPHRLHPKMENRRRRALLIEDDENERELLAGFLRLSGYDVDVAADGLCALDLLERCGRPDLVILDMHMPRLDGRATLSAIRRNPDLANLKVYAVSGTDREEWPPASSAHDVDRWFTKPLNPLEFVDQLNLELRPAVA
ncbi:MAG: carbon storage regulator [Pirellulales bacterium]